MRKWRYSTPRQKISIFCYPKENTGHGNSCSDTKHYLTSFLREWSIRNFQNQEQSIRFQHKLPETMYDFGISFSSVFFLTSTSTSAHYQVNNTFSTIYTHNWKHTYIRYKSLFPWGTRNPIALLPRKSEGKKKNLFPQNKRTRKNEFLTTLFPQILRDSGKEKQTHLAGHL